MCVCGGERERERDRDTYDIVVSHLLSLWVQETLHSSQTEALLSGRVGYPRSAYTALYTRTMYIKTTN